MARGTEEKEEDRHDTARPRSGMVTTGPNEVVRRLVDVASSGGELRETLERMLQVLVELEPHAAAGISLHPRGLTQRHFWMHHAEGLSLTVTQELQEGRMFPELAEEVVAPLTCEASDMALDGTLHYAASSFENAPAEVYEEILQRAAMVIGMVVRMLRAESELRTGREQLAHLQKLADFGQTAAGIVHELNNPLTAIVAYSDFLLKRSIDRGVADADVDRLRRISEAATRIQQFCRELVDYSRPGALHGPVDVHAVIDRALSFSMHSLRSADITVERTYRDIPMVMGVDTQLTQVFVNLFTNAWHSMAEVGGTLSIRTRAETSVVTIEVADEGHGIELHVLPHIFDSYFTTKPRGQGAGLGLSIVRQILNDHSGQIRAENREPKGTIFYIELPVGM
jgi:C4-dicarboxylate-specific signal transduction histidine kinase